MSFYSEMAETAVSMIAEFGFTLNIVRPAYNFDNSNQPVSGGTVNHSTTAIFTSIKKMPVSGSRIEMGERVLVLVPTFKPRMSDLIDTSTTGDATATTVGAAAGTILSQGQQEAWTIKEIQEINPAGTPIAYFLRISK